MRKKQRNSHYSIRNTKSERRIFLTFSDNPYHNINYRAVVASLRKTMVPKVIDAKYIKDFVIHLRFAGGAEGDVNLQNELDGEDIPAAQESIVFQAVQSPQRAFYHLLAEWSRFRPRIPLSKIEGYCIKNRFNKGFLN